MALGQQRCASGWPRHQSPPQPRHQALLRAKLGNSGWRQHRDQRPQVTEGQLCQVPTDPPPATATRTRAPSHSLESRRKSLNPVSLEKTFLPKTGRVTPASHRPGSLCESPNETLRTWQKSLLFWIIRAARAAVTIAQGRLGDGHERPVPRGFRGVPTAGATGQDFIAPMGAETQLLPLSGGTGAGHAASLPALPQHRQQPGRIVLPPSSIYGQQ